MTNVIHMQQWAAERSLRELGQQRRTTVLHLIGNMTSLLEMERRILGRGEKGHTPAEVKPTANNLRPDGALIVTTGVLETRDREGA